MGIKFSDIEDRIILIDAASHTMLRENTPDLLATLAHMIKKYNINNFVVIDDDDFDILPYISLNNFININRAVGINFKDIEKILEDGNC